MLKKLKRMIVCSSVFELFRLLLFEGISRFFLLCLLDVGRIRIQIRACQIMADPDPGGTNTYGSGSTTLVCSLFLLQMDGFHASCKRQK
jgi:hypothetical protein